MNEKITSSPCPGKGSYEGCNILLKDDPEVSAVRK